MPVFIIALCIVTPPAPVASTIPLLLIVLAPASNVSNAPALPLMTPPVLLTRVICPPPMFPAPEIVLVTFVRTAPVPVIVEVPDASSTSDPVPFSVAPPPRRAAKISPRAGATSTPASDVRSSISPSETQNRLLPRA